MRNILCIYLVVRVAVFSGDMWLDYPCYSVLIYDSSSASEVTRTIMFN